MNNDFYWLGFILADGCIYEPPGNRQEQLCVTSKDREHLVKLQEWAKTGKINEHVEGGRWLYRASSNSLCAWLRSFGITPRKTGKETVDPRLQSSVDFWRGMVDGDGWLQNRTRRQKYETKAGIKECEFTTAVLGLCGSRDVCEAFRRFMEWENEVKKFASNCHRIVGEARKARKGIRKLYKGADISLDRKQETAMTILEMEESPQKRERKKTVYPLRHCAYCETGFRNRKKTQKYCSRPCIGHAHGGNR